MFNFSRYMKITIKDLNDFNNITQSIENKHIKVKTKYGFKLIENIGITLKDSIKLKISTTNFTIIVSKYHLLYKMGWVKSNTLKKGDLIDTINGYEKIILIENDNKAEDLYDIQVSNNEFYANNIRCHNSSFQESFDFSIFGVVRGKSMKRAPLKILPNRVNKNTEVEIEFINNFNNKIKFIKYLEPTSGKFFENEKDETKKFKSISKEEREKIIGFNFETYKSFISMSISDFGNFINLKPEDKRKIINKLFNLQELDNYLSIVKDIIKGNSDNIIKYQNIIDINNETIKSYKQNIRNIKSSGIINKEIEISNFKKELNSKKIPYNKSKNKNVELIEEIKTLQYNIKDWENKKDIILQELFEYKLELKNINEKIRVYKTGVCPVCDTKLDDDEHEHNLNDIEENGHKIMKIFKSKNIEKDDIILEITKLYNLKESKIKEKSDNIIKHNNLIYEIKIVTKKIMELKDKEDYVSIDEIENSINILTQKNSQYDKKIDGLNNNNLLYDELKNIFSTKGIRKAIIKNIITPLNVYLKDILDELNSPYNVKLNEEFNVTIYEKLINEINSESLSVGEAKKINVAIALSYLKLILKVKKLNILFLDEIFSSMQPKNVELALKVLKSFSTEYKINIIIVDPEVYFNDNSILGLDYFDRILKIKKKMNFSFIEDGEQN